MGRHTVPVILGVATGLLAAGFHNPEDTSRIDEHFRNGDKQPNTQIGVDAPQTSIDYLMAFAVGKISGTVVVEGEYDETRWGPVPNCSIDIEMELPFVAEPIVQLSDLEITKGTPDNTGGYDVHVKVGGDVEVLNPRSKLDESVVEHEGNSWGQICSENNYDNLINSMWEIGGLATNTAAECLANSVQTQYITDLNGNQIQTEASAAIHSIYEDDLKLAMEALYPNGRVTVEWPAPDPNYDVSNSASYQALEAAIAAAEADDDKYTIDAEAVKTCTFASLALDVSTVGEGDS